MRRALRRRVRPCARSEIELRAGRRASIRPRGVPRRASRRRCSSARPSTISACRKCSTRWWTSPRRRGRKPAIQRVVQPDETKFTGVVFKIQANMDPAHRDRVAFVRVCSGHFERGMRLKLARTGKDLPTEQRGLVPVAAPRAARGRLCRRHHRHPQPRRAAAGRHADRGRDAAVHRAAVLRARDLPHAWKSPTRCAPSSCAPGCSSWARKARSRCSGRVAGGALLLGAVGQLQFEVVAHRLEHEYGVRGAHDARHATRLARWVTRGRSRRARALHRGQRPPRRPRRGRRAGGAGRAQAPRSRSRTSIWPKIHFHALREHAGLVFHAHLAEA